MPAALFRFTDMDGCLTSLQFSIPSLPCCCCCHIFWDKIQIQRHSVDISALWLFCVDERQPQTMSTAKRSDVTWDCQSVSQPASQLLFSHTLSSVFLNHCNLSLLGFFYIHPVDQLSWVVHLFSVPIKSFIIMAFFSFIFFFFQDPQTEASNNSKDLGVTR